MSQVSIIDIEGNHPQIPTQFNADIGFAIPLANELNIFGDTTVAGTTPVHTEGAGNTITVINQLTQAIAATNADNVGLAAFDSAAFSVDANGFVTLTGGGGAMTNIDVDANTAPGTDPVVPDGVGNIIFTGAQVASGTVGANVLRTNSLAANSVTYEIQRTTSSAGSSLALNGVAHFDSTDFSVDANGFVALAGAGAGQTITGDTGGALPPTAGNWDILGQQASTTPVMFTVGSGSTLNIEDRTWTSSLVVDPSATVGLRGTFQTITAALAAASSGQTIFIRRGTYTENLTLKAGVNLAAYDCDAQNAQVIIVGSVAASFSGSCSISGINLQSNAFLMSGANATIVNLINCYLTATSGTCIANTVSNVSSILNIISCNGDITDPLGSIYNQTGTGITNIYKSNFLNSANSVITNGNSNGFVNIFSSLFSNGVGVTTSGSTQIFDSSVITSTQNSVSLSGNNGTTTCSNCYLSSGTASAISMTGNTTIISAINTTINTSNANAIERTGGATPTIRYGNLTFNGTSSVIDSTLIQIPLISSNDAVQIKTPGAYPYTTIPQDGVILVDSSSARTIVPLASPTTGQMHRIKDSVGSAGANNITITPSGKNIDGVASYVIATNYGSADIVYTGTEWSVL